MANIETESKLELISQLEAQGWGLVNIIGKIWYIKDTGGHTASIEVTAHRDGRQADYEILSTNNHEFHPDLEPVREAEQDAIIKRELEEEIEREQGAIKMFDYDWFRPEWKGNRREHMRRYHERKLARAEEFYNEALSKGWF